MGNSSFSQKPTYVTIYARVLEASKDFTKIQKAFHIVVVFAFPCCFTCLRYLFDFREGGFNLAVPLTGNEHYYTCSQQSMSKDDRKVENA